jgi:HK97 family phage major capsid protein
MTLQEIREKQAKLVADARAKMEEIKSDTPEARAKEIEAEYDAMMAEYDRLDGDAKVVEARDARRQQADDRQRETEERQAAIEEARNRPDPRRPTGNDIIVPQGEDAKVTEARKAAFDSYLRYGAANLGPEQRKLLIRAQMESRASPQSTQIGTQGGYLVFDSFMLEFIISLKAYGPMMDDTIVRRMTTSMGNTISWPTLDDTSNKGRRIPENTQVTTAEVAFGTKGIDAYKYTSDVVLVPSEMLTDTVFDVQGLIRGLMAERIGRIGNEELTTGTNASMPNGIATAAAAGYTAASATGIVFDDLIELEHSVDPAYRTDPSVRFMFNDGTLKALRKLKDGDGRYIWQPADVKGGIPNTINNYPYSINQDMASVATGNRSVLFGAFNRYVHRMVKEFAIRRLDERYADSDQVGFIGFMRMDGELLDTNAVRRLTHP